MIVKFASDNIKTFNLAVIIEIDIKGIFCIPGFALLSLSPLYKAEDTPHTEHGHDQNAYTDNKRNGCLHLLWGKPVFGRETYITAVIMNMMLILVVIIQRIVILV